VIGNRWLRLGAAGVGAAAAAVTAGVMVERRVVQSRRAGAAGADELGGLRGEERTVLTDDGVALHAEVDEVAPYDEGSKNQPRKGIHVRRQVVVDEPTVVFVHGYALNLQCWHFQRAYFRGKHRMVFYDQRSHGRSLKSDKEHASIEQLGDDLRRVLGELVPRGPVVLVGHSMGGMAVLAFAERHPELFEERVVGVALISTTAGGLKPHQLLSGLIPDAVGVKVAPRVMAGLALAPSLVDRVRRRGSNIGYLVADEFAFGEDVPSSYVEFVNNMLAETSFEALAQFYPHFDRLDKYKALDTVGRVPTYVISGTKDVMTSIGHSRAMAARMPGAVLVEVPGAGHMVILENKDRVNSALETLFAATADTPASQVS
jgi:pimeloyl-ACP methyl ester carboxylesterase